MKTINLEESMHVADLAGFSEMELHSFCRFINKLLRENVRVVLFITDSQLVRISELNSAESERVLRNCIPVKDQGSIQVRMAVGLLSRSKLLFIYSKDDSLIRSLGRHLTDKLFFHIRPAVHGSVNRMLEKMKSILRIRRAIPAALAEGKFTGGRIQFSSDNGDMAQQQSRPGKSTVQAAEQGGEFRICYLAETRADDEELRNIFRGIRSFRKACGVHTNLHLIISVVNHKMADALAAQYGLSDDICIHISPGEEEQRRIIDACDAVVSLPVRKKYSVRILQCMLSGKPVIVNRNRLNAATLNAAAQVYCVDEDMPHDVFNAMNVVYWNKKTAGGIKPKLDHWMQEFAFRMSFSF